MRYINFYGDGDTKRFAFIEKMYPGIKVTKFQYIGHVQKRMCKRLRTLRKSVKGLDGIGRLNDAMVDKIQNYYGIAIKQNTGKDINTMKSAIWGAFFTLLPTLRSYLMALSLGINGTIIANVEQKVGANSNKIYQIKQKHILLDLGYQTRVIRRTHLISCIIRGRYDKILNSVNNHA